MPRRAAGPAQGRADGPSHARSATRGDRSSLAAASVSRVSAGRQPGSPRRGPYAPSAGAAGAGDPEQVDRSLVIQREPRFRRYDRQPSVALGGESATSSAAPAPARARRVFTAGAVVPIGGRIEGRSTDRQRSGSTTVVGEGASVGAAGSPPPDGRGFLVVQTGSGRHAGRLVWIDAAGPGRLLVHREHSLHLTASTRPYCPHMPHKVSRDTVRSPTSESLRPTAGRPARRSKRQHHSRPSVGVSIVLIRPVRHPRVARHLCHTSARASYCRRTIDSGVGSFHRVSPHRSPGTCALARGAAASRPRVVGNGTEPATG